jgi:Zn-dependent protease/CBS domain-containing protein
MGNGIRVARILGIEIRVDWSWLLIFVLVTWSVSATVSQYHPDWSIALDWGLALIASLAFFGSVLTHELAHSLVARANGVPVRNITLFLFGGVSNIQREPSSPRAEFLVTVVGPLTSVILGIVFGILAFLTSGRISLNGLNPNKYIQQLGPLPLIFAWLGSINLILAVFNLVPGFPLDGGRVLRSVLWAVSGNLRQATRWATIIGQIIAWAMIFAGIAMVFGIYIPFLGTGFINGVWLAFIGWFLSIAATQSYQEVVIRGLLEDVQVQTIMQPDPKIITPDTSISALVHDYLIHTDERAFPVLQDGSLIGLVTTEDVRKAPKEEWESKTVRQIMTPVSELKVASLDGNVAEALQMLQKDDVRQLPVIEEGKLVGLLRRRDIIRWLHLRVDHSR